MQGGTCCLWLRDSPYEVVPLTLFRITYLLLFILWQVAALFIAIGTSIATVVSELYSLVPVLIFAFLSFVWFLYYPDLQPYISTTGVQLLNLAFQLFQLFWNLAIILWNLFVLVWNAAAPIIGMIIYVALEVFTSLLTAVVKILGQVDVYALFKPFIEILEVLTRMLVEIIQALVSAAIGLLTALTKIIGALITVVISVTKILFPIVVWIVGLLFKLLFPVLKVVIAIVSWFINLFSAARMHRRLQALTSIGDIEAAYARYAQMRERLEAAGPAEPLFGRRPLGFADVDPEDDAYTQGWGSLHDTMYPQANWAASRHFSNGDRNRAAETELQVMLRMMDEAPLHSFSYYWYVNRPVLIGIDGGALPPADVYTGEVGTSQDPRAIDPAFMRFVPRAPARALLEFASSRGLLSAEERAVLESAEPVGINDYWKRMDAADVREDVLAWYSHQHYTHQQKRQHAINKLRDGLRSSRIESADEYYAAVGSDGEANRPRLSYEEYKRLQEDLAEADRLQLGLPAQQRRRHPYADDLDGRHACKHRACGGRGQTLPHAVHTIRKLSHRRQQRADEASWKAADQTEEEYQKSKTVHVHVLGHATHEALDRLKWHLQNPVLHQHARAAWKRLSGHDDAGSALDAYHASYNDPGEWMLTRIGSLSDWRAFRWLAERDEEFEKRPYFGDWARRQLDTTEGVGEWHSRKLQALGPEMSAHRELLALDDPGAQQAWLASEPTSDIDELFDADSGLDPDAAGALPRAAYLRRLMAFPLPLPDVPNVYQQQQSAASHQANINSQKPHPSAILPLFQLLTETDCYTSTPRNPLCLPHVPASWSIKTAPHVTWPPNATANDGFCAPTFKLVPRCFTCWQSWINWRWLYNALQLPRLILSAIPVFTDTMYQLAQTYPFLRWLFQLPFALPLGHKPTVLDWICVAIYVPYALAFTYLVFLVLALLYPVVLVAIMAFNEGWVLDKSWVEANTAYYQAMQAREILAIQMAMKDSPANPSPYMPGNYRGDPNYLWHGPGGMTPAHVFAYGGDKNMIFSNNAAPYQPGVLGRTFNGPYNPTMHANPAVYMQRRSPYAYDPAGGAPTYAGFPSTAVPGVKDAGADVPGADAAAADAAPDAATEALEHLRLAHERTARHGVRQREYHEWLAQAPRPLGPDELQRARSAYAADLATIDAEYDQAVAQLEAERLAREARAREAAVAETHRQQLLDLRAALTSAFLEVGIPRLEATAAERHGPERGSIVRHLWEWFCDDRVDVPTLARFERFYHVLLIPFQHSWLWQRQYRHHYGARSFFAAPWAHPELNAEYVHHFLPPRRDARREDQLMVALPDGGSGSPV